MSASDERACVVKKRLKCGRRPTRVVRSDTAAENLFRRIRIGQYEKPNTFVENPQSVVLVIEQIANGQRLQLRQVGARDERQQGFDFLIRSNSIARHIQVLKLRAAQQRLQQAVCQPDDWLQ